MAVTPSQAPGWLTPNLIDESLSESYRIKCRTPEADKLRGTIPTRRFAPWNDPDMLDKDLRKPSPSRTTTRSQNWRNSRRSLAMNHTTRGLFLPFPNSSAKNLRSEIFHPEQTSQPQFRRRPGPDHDSAQRRCRRGARRNLPFHRILVNTFRIKTSERFPLCLISRWKSLKNDFETVFTSFRDPSGCTFPVKKASGIHRLGESSSKSGQ
jgi:hypothetical protein